MAALVLGDISAVLAAFNATKMSFTSFVSSNNSAEASEKLDKADAMVASCCTALTRVMILAAMETGSAMSHNHDHGRPLRTSCSQSKCLVLYGPSAGFLFGARLSSVGSIACCTIAESVSYRASSSPAQASRRVT